jgi:hypothetical protein
MLHGFKNVPTEHLHFGFDDVMISSLYKMESKMKGDKLYTIKVTEEAVKDILDLINGGGLESISAEISERGEEHDTVTIHCAKTIDDLMSVQTINIQLNK